MERPKRVLALDIGDARIGLALSDLSGILASPAGIVNNRNRKQAIKEIIERIEQEKVSTILVGLPILLNGEEGPQSQIVRRFASVLETEIDKSLSDLSINKPELVFWDERLSTVEAERHTAGSKLRNRAKSELLDQVSAVIILESYLNSRR